MTEERNPVLCQPRSQPADPAREAHCPVCGGSRAHPEWQCPRCETPHHDECARYFGGCAIFGCRDAHLPDRIEQDSWPRAINLLVRYAQLRVAQNRLALAAIGSLNLIFLLAPFRRVDWLDVAREIAPFLFLLACACYGLVEIALRWLGMRIERALGRPSKNAMAVPTERLNRLIARGRAGTSLRWLGPAGWIFSGLGFGAGIAIRAGLEAAWPYLCLLVPGFTFLALREHWVVKQAEADVLTHRVRASCTARVQLKPSTSTFIEG